MKEFKTYNEFLLEKSSNISDIVKTGSFAIEIGSSTQSQRNPSEDDVNSYISQFINHYFFDKDFYSNYTDHEKEYKEWYLKHVKEPFLKNIDKFFKDYVELKSGKYRIKSDLKLDVIIAKQFKDKTMPESVRFDWNLHRWDYAGEKNDPKRYEYLGEWPNKTIKNK